MIQTKKGKKMKMTVKRARAIRTRYEELLSLAAQFVGGSDGSDSVRFGYAGNIERYTNHACHCHPDYYWEQKKTAAEFEEWLGNR
jgi:hypothetical protein